MSLAPGARLGPYEVVSAIGEGGMGQVFRARDTKLNREVALKVLSDSFANDADRLARFTREAQTLAALNHPNIAHIHGLEESGGVRALVMELVEGEDLAQRIARGAIPLDEALPIARQIAEALEAAHEQGIIHRDLKPANIKVRPDGTVKVLDFGLAKAMDRPPSSPNLTQSPTMASPAMTIRGMILGTAAYMAPEQAKGKTVDKRADIWAFGCVLFEMVTGRPAFSGDTVPEILADVMKSEPAWQRLPVPVPATLQGLLRRCLMKEPRQRIRDVGDVRLALEGAFETPAPLTTAAAGPAAPRRRAWAALAIATLVATALVLGVVVGGWYQSASVPPAAVVRFDVQPPPDVTLSPAPVASAAQLALSPDGRRLVFVAAKRRGVSQLWVRALDSTEAQPLPGTEGASFPFWSPDGRSLAFFATGKLKKIDTAGGAPQVLCDASTGRGGSWSPNGTIVFADNINSPLLRIAAGGGAVTPLTTLDPAQGALSHYFPQFLPDGRHFLYYQRTRNAAEYAGTYVGVLDSAETQQVLGAAPAVYSAGLLWSVRSGTLFAQAFDIQSLRTTSEPLRVADGLGYFNTLGYAGVAVSATGVVAHGPAVVLNTSVQTRDRRGGSGTAPTPPGLYRSPRLSPDEQSLALAITESGAPTTSDIWVLDLARRAMSRATVDPSGDWFPAWSPDSRRLFFGATRLGSTRVFEKTLGGTEALFAKDTLFTGAAAYPLDVSRDERFLLTHTGSSSGYDLEVLTLAGDRQASVFLSTPFNEVQGRFSPNGLWVAYASDESGRFEIYVRPFPAASGQTQISLAGGMQPEWRGDGRELFYIASDGKLTAVPVTTDRPTFAAGTPQALFDVEVPEPSPPYANDYAVTAEGQRFYVNALVDQPTRPALTVILNWTPESTR